MLVEIYVNFYTLTIFYIRNNARGMFLLLESIYGCKFSYFLPYFQQYSRLWVFDTGDYLIK